MGFVQEYVQMKSMTCPHAARLRTAGVCVATVLVGALAGVLVPDSPLEAKPRKKKSNRPLAGLLPVDEPLAVRFRRPVRGYLLNEKTVRISIPESGELARGEFVAGSLLRDPQFGRTVTIRPEAIQEYYQLVDLLPREEAAARAARLIRKIEKTGRFKLLDKIDAGLRAAFGPAAGAGTRLDQSGVHGFYPPTGATGDPTAMYRQTIAGDDDLWAEHLEGDPDAFPQLAQNSQFERFFHTIDAVTGRRADTSVLARREHRRELRSLRNRRMGTFVPRLPTDADATDTGFRSAASYVIQFPERAVQPSSLILDTEGNRLASFKGYFQLDLRTQAPLFRSALDSAEPPSDFRVVNVTPPDGESNVDQSTSWESPDNSITTPVFQRRRLAVHLRFADPVDPRTVNGSTVELRKIGTLDDDTVVPVEPPETVDAVVSVRQSRLGEVAIDLAPVLLLDPRSEYELIVSETVRSLAGVRLGRDFRSTFRTQ